MKLLQFILSLKYPLLLVLALSVDTFATSFAYGNANIRIPTTSAVIINCIGSAILALSLLFGYLIMPIVPDGMTKAICFVILSMLGIVKLFDSSIKAIIRKKNGICRRISFSVSSLHFILNIYANPEQADKDLSKTISYSEAVFLAVAVSLDSIAVGFGAALAGINPIITPILSFIIGMTATKVGLFVGKSVSSHTSRDFSWISGALLLLLAFFKL